SVLQGSLVRDGSRVLLDFALLPVDGGAEPLARGSATGDVESVAALTDSTVRTLLRQVWVGGAAPTPSLEGALRTRSADALRAFLSGERWLTRGQWDSATVAFGRAREADPGFVLAAARQAYAFWWSLQKPPDGLLAELRLHGGEMADAERLSSEAIVLQSQDSIGLSLERARELTQRHRSSWFGWLMYADQALHNGPLLGHSHEEAWAGFARALERHPHLIPVHEHRMLLAIQSRDTATAAASLDELARLGAGPAMSADGYGTRMLQFRFLLGLVRGDSATTLALTDSIARDPKSADVSLGTFYDPFRHGFLDAQIRVSERALQLGVPRQSALAAHRLLAWSWAGRGRWDSALVAMDRLSASGLDSLAPIRAYGVAVLGAWLGALQQDEVQRRRAAIAPARRDAEGRAELAWLDGVAAMTRRDRSALAAARAALGRSAAPSVAALDRSLAAFEQGLRGDSAAAGAALARLEWEEAAVAAPHFRDHPFTIAVDRMVAARWLAHAGGAEEAARLLTWVDGVYFLHPSTPYGAMLRGLAGLERGRIEERRSRADAAAAHYRTFLQQYDQPMPSHRAMVDEARERLARLEASGPVTPPPMDGPASRDSSAR
ncbi:MAG TPA: hypothetical protein VFX50_16310, partial [Gemmatimonadales bacterium]|nr:hypothetical protein [Gemmatimonadales bacterium]